MSIEQFAKSKPGLSIGVLLLVLVTYRIANEVQQVLAELPVRAPNKVAAQPKTKAQEVPQVYRVLATPAAPQRAVTTSGTAVVDSVRIERLFKTESGMPAPMPAVADPQLRLPAPGSAAADTAKLAGAPMMATAVPDNLFRVDGISNGGAFIAGRYFKTGDVLDGIAFPEPLPEGEKARLEEVSWDAIKIMLGKKLVVLTRPKE